MPVRILGLTVMVAATAACLPRGEVPAGTQLLTDRSASLAALVPPNGDGLLRILLMRPGATTDSANLSVVSLDADDQLSPEVPLIADIDPVSSVNCPGGVAPCGFDDQGRVQIFKKAGGSVRLDPVTGDMEPLNPLGQPPAVKRYYRYDTQTSGTLVDADGHATPIMLATPAPGVFFAPYTFVGDDFYYVDPQNELIDIPPTDVPQQVATGVTYFRFLQTDAGPVLGLIRTTSDGTATRSSVGDPRSGMETVLPFDVSEAVISPDGRWVLDTGGQANGQFTFFDRSSGSAQLIAVGQQAQFTQWRPGTDEAWVTSFDTQPTVWVLRPDASPVSVPGVALSGVSANIGVMQQSFTADGAYWFAQTPTAADNTNIIQVGSADDPAGPRYDLNPPATFVYHAWYLPDDRVLATSYVKDTSRADANVVDLRTGVTRLVGERGVVAAVGQTRFMGMFHMEESRGDLIAGGFENEGSSQLAREFTARAFAEPQGADLLAPGTRIVYQFQARTASPYDGIWVVNCP
jgi:hypothetical protein